MQLINSSELKGVHDPVPGTLRTKYNFFELVSQLNQSNTKRNIDASGQYYSEKTFQFRQIGSILCQLKIQNGVQTK